MPGHDLLTQAMYTYKILLDKHTRKYGGNVTFLNQHSVLWGVQKQQSHSMKSQSYKGVCAGLAIEWARATLKGEDFMSRLNKARSDMMVNGKSKGLNEDSQGLFTGIDDAHREQTDVEAAFKSVARCSKDVEMNYPFSNAHKQFKNGYFYYISTGTHATALFCHGDKITFYDPNVGVASNVKKQMIEHYLQECIYETYVNLTKDGLGAAQKKKLNIIEFKPH